MNGLFTIGEVSKLFDINIKTLRYYDEIIAVINKK